MRLVWKPCLCGGCGFDVWERCSCLVFLHVYRVALHSVRLQTAPTGPGESVRLQTAPTGGYRLVGAVSNCAVLTCTTTIVLSNGWSCIRCGYKPHLPSLGKAVRLKTAPTRPGGSGRLKTEPTGLSFGRRCF